MAKISIDSSNSGASKKSYGVVDKIELGEEHVWDITVDDEDHTYWSGGLLVSNCGEIWLPSMGCCCLGALVLPRFIKNGKVDWDKLDETVRVSVRFLDNVLTVNNYPLPEIKDMCEKERRIGLGVMGLHSMLMDLGLPYESQDSFDFVDKLFEKIKISAYHASVDLAIEKGPFPLYNHKMLDSGFMKGMKNSVKRRVKEYGVRNCALLTIAPTGTTSMVHGVTGGIEPLFAPAYIRRRFMKTDKAGEKKTIETLVVSKDYTDHPEIAQGAYDVSVRGHFEMQKVCQKHIDNATSKTINLPKDFPVSELSDIWLEYLDCMKGATFYREGSRENEPMSPIPLKQAKKIIESWGGETEFEQNYSLDCSKGTCDLPLP
jgi:ribonucleoside-diphosphate reductase alpha chain